jgi:hypothetical protein
LRIFQSAAEPPAKERQDFIASGDRWLISLVDQMDGYNTVRRRTCRGKNGGTSLLAALSGTTRATKRSPSAAA